MLWHSGQAHKRLVSPADVKEHVGVGDRDYEIIIKQQHNWMHNNFHTHTQVPVFSKHCKSIQIEWASHKLFKYLGHTVTSNGRYDPEIKKRIKISKVSFTKMSNIMKNRNVMTSTEIHLRGRVCVIYLSVRIWMLDNEYWNGDKTMGSTDVVY